jgi:hypothetical protein
MHVIGQSNVHGVDVAAAEEVLKIVVIAKVLDAVTSTYYTKLFRCPGHQRRQLAVASRVPKGRQYGALSDMTQTY